MFGCFSRSIETTGAALGLDKMGLNCPKVHRNLSYEEIAQHEEKNKEGVFTNMISRQYVDAKVTEGGSFGSGKKWKLHRTELNDLQKKELDCLYGDMMEFVGGKSKDGVK